MSNESPQPRIEGLLADELAELAVLGVSFRELTNDQVNIVSDRDFGGFYQPQYTAERSLPINFSRTGVFIEDNLVAFSIAGMSDREGRLSAEVAIMHVSPVVRNRGLGVLINSMTKLMLVSKGAEVLRSEVLDDSGKIAHMLEKQGYSYVKKKYGSYGNEIWEREITSIEEKSVLQATLVAEARRAVNFLKQQADLWDAASLVDVDNPGRVDIVEVVATRLKKTIPYDKQKDHINIFGYMGNLVHLYSSFQPRELSNKQLLPWEKDQQAGDFQVTLVVRGVTPEDAQCLLATEGTKGKYQVRESLMRRGGTPTDVVVLGTLSTDRNILDRQAIELARLAERLFLLR